MTKEQKIARRFLRRFPLVALFEIEYYRGQVFRDEYRSLYERMKMAGPNAPRSARRFHRVFEIRAAI